MAPMRHLACLLVAALPLANAEAALRVRADRVRAGAVEIGEAALAIEAGALAFSAARVDAADFGLAARALRWQCALETTAGGYRCSGTATMRRDGASARGTLSIERSADVTNVALADGRARAAWTTPARGDAELGLTRVPLRWLAPLLARYVPGAIASDGAIDGTITIGADDPPRTKGKLALDDVAFDTPDGTLAAAGLDAQVSFETGGAPGARRCGIDAKLERGAWLVAPVYVELAEPGVALALDVVERDGGYAVTSWRWDDPETLVAQGSAALDSDGSATRIDLATLDAPLDRAYPRYAKSALAGTAFADLEVEGRLRGTLGWTRGERVAGVVELDEVTAHDARGRFAIDALSGRLPLSPPRAETGSLRWRSASIHRIPIAGGALSLRADPDGYALAAPLELSTLEGTVRIPSLEYRRRREGQRVAASIELVDLSVAALTRALGWTEFGGRLSGTIPALRSEGDVVAFDGGLTLSVFGGQIRVGDLALERAFGVAPSLAADVAIEDLDLAALTNTFSFGSIEGRLDGRIGALRLVDWRPVAFDLALRTDDAYDGRKRISQRAVDSLSAVGGAGVAAGIQRSVLKVFDTFPYGAIGLTCRLANNVCTMGGLDSDSGGYTIVRGAGLPRLTVVGHQRRVDWPVLVARLRAATEGTAPVVE